jgi:hypothetical protein
MKKNYTSNLLMTIASFISISVFAQQAVLDKAKPSASVYVQSGSGMQTGDDGAQHLYQPTAGSSVAGVSCDSLKTTFAMGNGNDGTMFNVVASLPLSISYIDCILNGDTGMVYIYHRPGSMTGHETSMTGWVKDSVMMSISSQDSLYRIPIYLNIAMNTNDTTAFYVTGSGVVGMDYTDGTTIGNMFVQDWAMQVQEGTGVSYPFNPNFAPRVFNGIINYCPGGLLPCETATTTFAGGNGNAGNMFDVTSSIDITVNHFDMNINGTGYMKIYYHTGTFVGTESNPGAWNLIDSVLTTSAGANMPSTIPLYFALNIGAGTTMAFYITGTGSGATANYTNGTAVGNVFVNDGIVAIKEGNGMGTLFSGPGATPRIWNGNIYYCVATGIQQEQNSSAISSVVYPNPFNNTATLSFDTEHHADHLSVIISDISGRTIQQFKDVQGNQLTIDAANLSDGMYIYTIYNDNELAGNGKFIVE